MVTSAHSQTVLAPAAAGRWARMRSPLLGAGLILALTVALHLRDPHQHGSWGFCPLRLTTGFDCPGCGGLRAVNDLTNGHLAQAASSNLLFVVSIPLIVAAWIWWLSRSWRGLPTRPSPRVGRAILVTYVGVGLAFAVFRNTPWGHFLYA